MTRAQQEQGSAAALDAEPLVAVYAHVLRRGRRQAELVKALVDCAAGGSNDLDAGRRAAHRTAAFVRAEGWVTGSAWSVYGPRWLFARWALDREVPASALSEQLSVLREQETDRRAAATASRSSDERDRREGEAVSSGAGGRRMRSLAEGRRRGEALDVLFTHLLSEDEGIEGAMEAAQRTAQFAVEEGWARGSLWVAYGMQLIMARWAMEHGVSSQEIDRVMATRREAPTEK